MPWAWEKFLPAGPDFRVLVAEVAFFNRIDTFVLCDRATVDLRVFYDRIVPCIARTIYPWRPCLPELCYGVDPDAAEVKRTVRHHRELHDPKGGEHGR